MNILLENQAGHLFLLSVGVGGFAIDSGKSAAEGLGVVISALGGNFIHGLRRGLKKLFRFLNAARLDPLGEIDACFFFEERGKIFLRYVEMNRHKSKAEITGSVLRLHVGKNILDKKIAVFFML